MDFLLGLIMLTTPLFAILIRWLGDKKWYKITTTIVAVIAFLLMLLFVQRAAEYKELAEDTERAAYQILEDLSQCRVAGETIEDVAKCQERIFYSFK